MRLMHPSRKKLNMPCSGDLILRPIRIRATSANNQIEKDQSAMTAAHWLVQRATSHPIKRTALDTSGPLIQAKSRIFQIVALRSPRILPGE